MKLGMMCLLGVGALGTQALGLQGCQETSPTSSHDPAPAVAAGPIVNGQLETGYPPVGALTAWFGGQYGGAFCTATLIRPD